MNELFNEIPESKPNRLQLARIAMQRASDKLDECERILNEQGPKAKPQFDQARLDLMHAEYELRDAELEAKG